MSAVPSTEIFKVFLEPLVELWPVINKGGVSPTPALLKNSTGTVALGSIEIKVTPVPFDSIINSVLIKENDPTAAPSKTLNIPLPLPLPNISTLVFEFTPSSVINFKLPSDHFMKGCDPSNSKPISSPLSEIDSL